MKLSSGKRIGQSGQELATAVSFSFFLHVLFFFAAVFLYVNVTPRIHIPPFYDVKLVGLPADSAEVPQAQQGAPAAPKAAKPAPKPKARREHSKARMASKKNAFPELAAPGKKRTSGQESTAEEQRQTALPAPAGVPAASSAVREGVAVTAAQQDFPFAWYLANVREKIGQNWNPPPDAPDAKARVIFTINRSGWVAEVNLVQEQSNGTFGFKQAAVRAIQRSNPFPGLPEDFSKQSLQFTVDLMAVN